MLWKIKGCKKINNRNNSPPLLQFCTQTCNQIWIKSMQVNQNDGKIVRVLTQVDVALFFLLMLVHHKLLKHKG
ncbi:CLUMA_CG015537, isoform A [Clunio marinus]|uniref:CLUMA_CG015537, isoform A n=1 Tax=Clunio marinus TaxID=568069 RepID=A0A1J1ITZ6_9DIPT|nr:CLUMA_CG015537, isoform A [Clunio marinus]